jgi:uncharacterized protein (TIGR01244 family)
MLQWRCILHAVKIDDRLTAASQPDPASFGKLARDSFAAVVNARPDGEEPYQPGNDTEKAAAHSAGLDFAFIPVTDGRLKGDEVEAFDRARLPEPESNGKRYLKFPLDALEGVAW